MFGIAEYLLVYMFSSQVPSVNIGYVKKHVILKYCNIRCEPKYWVIGTAHCMKENFNEFIDDIWVIDIIAFYSTSTQHISLYLVYKFNNTFCLWILRTVWLLAFVCNKLFTQSSSMQFQFTTVVNNDFMWSQVSAQPKLSAYLWNSSKHQWNNSLVLDWKYQISWYLKIKFYW